MNKILKDAIIVIVLIAIIMSVFEGYVNAVGGTLEDDKRTGTLTITSYEQSNLNLPDKGLAGVEFTLYYVPKETETVEAAEEYIRSNEDVTTHVQTTPENGKVVFSELKLGRYLVVETNAPKNVIKRTESFLIDIPRTSTDGMGLVYDILIYPKSVSIYGSVQIEKKDQEGKALKETEWKIEKKNDENWENYIYEGSLETNEEGILDLQNLEVGQYRIYETKTKEGYILDQSQIYEFTIDQENTSHKFEAKNEKPAIETFVQLDDKSYGKNVGAYKKDKTNWKIQADIPSIISKMDTYTITNTITEGLNIEEGSIKVSGVSDSDTTSVLEADKYTKRVEDGKLIVELNTEKIKNLKKVEITYSAKFSKDVKHGEYASQANITYTDKINLEGMSESTHTTENAEAKVHTGSVLIYKVDDEDAPLAGAEFKIATTKDNAINSTFVQDENGADIVATSDAEGHVVFDGLKYGENNQTSEEASTKYWIVETKAPSYKEGIKTKWYKLQGKPIEVEVNNSSHNYSEEKTVKVVNKKVLDLPMTGGSILWILFSITFGILMILVSKKLKKDKTKKSKI